MGTPVPKGSCEEPRNEFDLIEFARYTLLVGAIISVIGIILIYLKII